MAETEAKTKIKAKMGIRVWRNKTKKWEEVKQGGN